MSNSRFVLDPVAFRERVLQSDRMLEVTKRYAAERAGKDSHLKPFIGFDRAKTIIYPNTKEHPS
ncbi:MAG: hypothetical protein K6E34_04565 [Lachnospiraceae bacterium]|nr:hypothetical protein [Lachnospiraceae bacterium]